MLVHATPALTKGAMVRGIKLWRFVYGAIFAIAAVALITTFALNAPSIAAKGVAKFGMDWALGSPVKRGLALGVIPFIGLWAVLALLERRFPANGIKPASNWFLNLKINLLGFLITPFLGVLLGVFLGYMSRSAGLIDLRLTHGVSPAKGLLAFLVWFFAVDFFYYWYHRFEHESFLWQQHKVHHMDEQVSAVTAHRVHWLEHLFGLVMVGAPVALLFKFDPSTGGIALGLLLMFRAIWQVFIHANLKVGFGRASRIFMSPQAHRIHHSRLPEHHDKNFAAFFPILDVIFGTYFHPRFGEYPPSGVHDEKDVTSFTASLFLPLREWWGLIRKRSPGRRARTRFHPPL
jgi:sterol desaturase/sphingolipid hydroxylase (fatty acid hydroxylase superfamily)